MAQRKPEEKTTLDQVIKLVDQLSPDEQEQLRRNLNNQSWGQRFDELCNSIEQRRIALGLPRLTEEEILAEVKTVRQERKARRAQSCS